MASVELTQLFKGTSERKQVLVELNEVESAKYVDLATSERLVKAFLEGTPEIDKIINEAAVRNCPLGISGWYEINYNGEKIMVTTEASSVLKKFDELKIL